MPFIGAVPAGVRSIVAEATRDWECSTIYIACSGNFTIERILADRQLALHGNDVSAYSCAIGSYLAGKKLKMNVQDAQYDWLAPYLSPGPEQIATLLLSTSMLLGYGKESPYYVRQNRAYQDQWPRLHEATTTKVSKALEGLTLSGFFAGDCVAHAKGAPADAGMIAFPPTYSGGYEKLYRAIGAVFKWDEPTYPIFDDDALSAFLDALTARKEWLFARDELVERLEGDYVGLVQPTANAKALHVYSSHATRRISLPAQKIEEVALPRFDEECVIGTDSEIGLLPLTPGQFNLIRAHYMKPGIAPAPAQLRLGVMIDNRLAGVLGFSRSMTSFALWEVYMMTDIAVRPTAYPRLSKLILALSLTREVKLLIEQMMNGRVRRIGTTAFTDKPVSMKYRGLYRLHGRSEGKINYVGDTGKWSMKEALAWWLKHHASTH